MRVLLQGAAVRVRVCGSGHAGAAAEQASSAAAAAHQHTSSYAYMPLGVLLQGAAAKVAWSWHFGAVEGCSCRVVLQGAVRVVCTLGAGMLAAKVLLQGCLITKVFLHLSNLATATSTGYCCQNAVRAHETWVLVSLQGVAAGCLWQCGHWALM